MTRGPITPEQIRKAFPQVGPDEVNGILIALAVAQKYGYGNIMAWLATEWARKLVDDGMSEEAARRHVSHTRPYTRDGRLL